MPLNQQAKTGVTVLAVVIGSDDQGETGLLLHYGGNAKHVWDTGDPLGHLLLLPCPVIKVNGKLQQPRPGRTTNGPEPSGITPPVKEL